MAAPRELAGAPGRVPRPRGARPGCGLRASARLSPRPGPSLRSVRHPRTWRRGSSGPAGGAVAARAAAALPAGGSAVSASGRHGARRGHAVAPAVRGCLAPAPALRDGGARPRPARLQDAGQRPGPGRQRARGPLRCRWPGPGRPRAGPPGAAQARRLLQRAGALLREEPVRGPRAPGPQSRLSAQIHGALHLREPAEPGHHRPGADGRAPAAGPQLHGARGLPRGRHPVREPQPAVLAPGGEHGARLRRVRAHALLQGRPADQRRPPVRPRRAPARPAHLPAHAQQRVRAARGREGRGQDEHPHGGRGGHQLQPVPPHLPRARQRRLPGRRAALLPPLPARRQPRQGEAPAGRGLVPPAGRRGPGRRACALASALSLTPPAGLAPTDRRPSRRSSSGLPGAQRPALPPPGNHPASLRLNPPPHAVRAVGPSGRLPAAERCASPQK